MKRATILQLAAIAILGKPTADDTTLPGLKTPEAKIPEDIYLWPDGVWQYASEYKPHETNPPCDFDVVHFEDPRYDNLASQE